MSAALAPRTGQGLAAVDLEALEATGTYLGHPVVSVTRDSYYRLGAEGRRGLTVYERCPSSLRRRPWRPHPCDPGGALIGGHDARPAPEVGGTSRWGGDPAFPW